jgi:hypothetical protein
MKVVDPGAWTSFDMNIISMQEDTLSWGQPHFLEQ